MFDSNCDGKVDQLELRRMMHSLHFDSLLLSEEYFLNLIRRVKGENIKIQENETIYFSVRLNKELNFL